jgi:CubicO group peptidase (beta-lactamase class C family)
MLIFVALCLPLTGKNPLPGQRFRAYITQEMSNWKVPGMAVGVIHDGKVILKEGYGLRHVKKNLPVTPKTIFAIGSATKSFTCCTLGLLVDEGKLMWDTPVKDYLPDFKLNDPYITNHITPRDLVNHNSGLPRHDLAWYGSKRTRKELYDSLRYLKFTAGFRSKFQYQNLMYMTAGYLAGQLSGGAWEEVVKKRIFEPLEMKDSNFSVLESQQSDDYALPYGGGFDQVERTHFYEGSTAIGPAGSINSNLEDMLKWVNLHLQEGKWRGKALVKKLTLEELHSPQVIGGGVIGYFLNEFKELSRLTYGMGWFIQHYRGRKILHHGGNIDGFSAQVLLMPDSKTGIVILSNKNGSFLPPAAAFHILDRLLGVQPPPWSARFKKTLNELRGEREGQADKKWDKPTAAPCPEPPPPSHALKAYTGKFQHPGYGAILISLEAAALQFKFNSFNSPLKHKQYNLFELTESMIKGARFQFHMDAGGEISAISGTLEPAIEPVHFKRAPDRKLENPAFLRKLTGAYDLKEGKLKIDLRGECTLTLAVQGQPLYVLEPYKGTSFKIKGIPGFVIEFVLDKDGNVKELISHQPNGDFTAKRKE